VEINWFTFFAQIVNFLIVLYLLKRFLYGPIMKAMAEREAQMAARFKEAEDMVQQASDEADKYRAERQEMDASREALMAEATEAAAERRSALIRDARAEIESTQSSWYAAVDHEKQRFLQDIRARMGESIFHIARDALADLANVELEEAIAFAFLDKLRNRSTDDHVENGLNIEPDEVIIVRSAFELSPDLQDRIQRALTGSPIQSDADETPPSDRTVAFRKSPDLICGIEAQFSSRRIAWNLRDYLDSYAEQLETALVAELETHGLHTQVDEQVPAANGILPG
jgi:F-type H+-transporting ATPase subunit b